MHHLENLRKNKLFFLAVPQHRLNRSHKLLPLLISNPLCHHQLLPQQATLILIEISCILTIKFFEQLPEHFEMSFLKSKFIRLQEVYHFLLIDRKLSLLYNLLDSNNILITKKIPKNPLKLPLIQIPINPLLFIK